MLKQIILALVFLNVLTPFVKAQSVTVPCMPSWHYRVPVSINNSTNTNALTQYQLKLQINTKSLIDAGKMKADGGDIRFTNAAGVALPFWIVDETVNTTQTEIWVKVDNIPMLSSINVYMFYGKSTANSVADGTSTFLHYDNFDGNSLDFNKWNFCGGAGGGTIPTVSGGEVTLGSSSAVYNHSISSSSSFTGPITTEMKLNSINNGVGLLSHTTAASNGYGMAMEKVGSIDNMRLVSSNSTSTSGACLALVNQSPTNPVNAGSVQGLWSFTWSKPNEQRAIWPGGTFLRTDYVDSSSFSSSKKVTLGSFTNTGSLSVDYIYTRKYSAIVPAFSFGSETELVDVVSATTNAPVCAGKNIELYAPSFSGAVYKWVGPNGFTSALQNPVITSSTFVKAGKYILEVSAPTGCSAVYDSVIVKLDSNTVAGVLSSSTTVCAGSNSDTIRLTGKVGKVVYWESALTLNGPWNTISITNSFLPYKNLLQTHYFRAIISSGTCGFDTTNIVTISVDEKSIGGNLIGSTNICDGYNTGNVLALNYRGAIKKWQFTENGTVWTDIATISDSIIYLNKTKTTKYRIQIKNGVCPAVYSDTATLQLQPRPVVMYYSNSECLGIKHRFINQSTIASGTIDKYYWSFGDGKSSTIVSPINLYDSVATYQTSLIAVSNFGCVDSSSRQVIVNPLPRVSFNFQNVCDTSTMSFTNTSTIASGTLNSYVWNFGDNSNVTSKDASHKYSKYGLYTTQLIVRSDSGCLDSTSKVVKVYRRAKVDFVVDSVCLGNSITLKNTTNTEADSTTYTWVFGNGKTSAEASPSIVYSNYGKYEVLLRATSFGMCEDISIDTVVIYPNPTAAFQFENVCQYDSLKIQNNSTIPYSAVTYKWDLGDSATSVLKSLSHYYTKPANYNIRLSVESEYGCKDEATMLTEVYPVPIANFDANIVCRDSITKFTNLSSLTSGTISYSWNFADGNSSILQNPTNIYERSGSYDVQLNVSSKFGCLDSISKDVIVHYIPHVVFSADSVCNGFITNLTNGSAITLGSIDEYLWNLGDGSNSILSNKVIHKYDKSGSYNVNLRAVSNKGCVHDTTITIVVHPNPIADFSFNNECIYDQVSFVNGTTIDFGALSYSWKFGDDSTSTNNSPIHVYNKFGYFPVQLIATSGEMCQDSLTKLIEIYALPLVDAGLDTSVSYGFFTPLEGVCPTAFSVTWTPAATVKDNASIITEARPLEQTEYTLEVTDQFGCVSSDAVIISVINDYKLLISNVITPNSDGNNDVWKIYNADAFEVIHIQVLDKWGKQVFTADNYSKEWDGNVNLDNLAEGTYYYLITFDESTRVYKGSVNILR